MISMQHWISLVDLYEWVIDDIGKCLRIGWCRLSMVDGFAVPMIALRLPHGRSDQTESLEGLCLSLD